MKNSLCQYSRCHCWDGVRVYSVTDTQPCRCVLLQKLAIAQLLKKFRAWIHYGCRYEDVFLDMTSCSLVEAYTTFRSQQLPSGYKSKLKKLYGFREGGQDRGLSRATDFFHCFSSLLSVADFNNATPVLWFLVQQYHFCFIKSFSIILQNTIFFISLYTTKS
jgi:hypothetical protein